MVGRDWLGNSEWCSGPTTADHCGHIPVHVCIDLSPPFTCVSLYSCVCPPSPSPPLPPSFMCVLFHPCVSLTQVCLLNPSMLCVLLALLQVCPSPSRGVSSPVLVSCQHMCPRPPISMCFLTALTHCVLASVIAGICYLFEGICVNAVGPIVIQH